MTNPQNDDRFVDPPWDEPLNVEEEIAAIDEGATVAGMFPAHIVEEANKLGQKLPSARNRYTRFAFYPQREHAKLLIEGCAVFFPKLTQRQALRKLGRAAVVSLLSSTIGKVMLASATTVEGALETMAKTYSINLRPGESKTISISNHQAIVELQDIQYFLDTLHIGVFEGVCKFAGAKNSVRIDRTSRTAARLLLTW